jgi:hypothetical protein
LEEARGQVRPGERLLDATLQLRSILVETREPLEAQPGDILSLDLQVEFEVMKVKEADLTAVARAALDANRVKGFEPSPGSLNITFASEPKLDVAEALNPVEQTTGVGTSVASHIARWSIKAERVLAASWSKAAAIRAIQGRGIADARRILRTSLQLTDAPQIRLYPAWWQWLPFLPARIEMVSR